MASKKKKKKAKKKKKTNPLLLLLRRKPKDKRKIPTMTMTMVTGSSIVLTPIVPLTHYVTMPTLEMTRIVKLYLQNSLNLP